MLNQPAQATAHLTPVLWAKANRLHLRKLICEFAHELLIFPGLEYTKDEWGYYKLISDQPMIEYHFRARILFLDHWYIDADSIEKFDSNIPVPLDSLQFVLEFKESLGIKPELLPVYLEEITNTLYGSAYMSSKRNLTVQKLIHENYQTIEHAMTAGHPCFVANNGRIGFDAIDYKTYAPESCKEVQLVWIAGHKSRTSYTGTKEIPWTHLLQHELDQPLLNSFYQILRAKGLEPDGYFFMPVHPWQWFNKLAGIFAPDIASNQLVCLGYGTDKYLAQQSIRTFYNISVPQRFYVKTALSILNMGFVRGLSPYYMESTPAITAWIKGYLGNDPYLKHRGFTMLCEVAAVGYRNPYYEDLGKNIPYNKMLAALWRESPASVLQPGQQLMTMAALLHIDDGGKALLPELIKSSGLSAQNWLKYYLKSYFAPLLHCFYAYDIAFMPHGENLILVMENNIPVKVIMKDITEEVMLFNPDVELPEKVKRIYVPTPDDVKLLCIFTDVFDCFFRFVSSILEQYRVYQESEFWLAVADVITEYQKAHPHLAEKFKRYNLFAPDFTRSCFNRLQLRNNQQMIDLADPHKNLQLIGTIKNPLAAFNENTY